MASAEAQAEAQVVTFRLNVEGASQTSQAFGQAASAMRSASGATSEATESFKAHSSASDEMLEKSHKLGTAFRFMRGAMYGLPAEIGDLTHGFHMAASAATALDGAFMGGGIGALAGGGLILAMTLYADHVKEAKKATEELAKSQREAIALALEFEKDERPLAERDAANRRNRLEADTSGFNPEQWRQRARDIAAQKQAKDDEYYSIVNKQQAQDMEEYERKMTAAGAGPQELKGGGKPSPKYGDLQQNMEFLEQDYQAEQKHKQELAALDDQMRADALQRDLESGDRKRKLEMEDEQHKRAFFIKEYAREASEKSKIDAARKRETDQATRAGLDAAAAIGSQGIAALAALAKGEKVTAQQVVAGIGDAMVASGTRYLFEGLALSIISPGHGGALIGIGTGEIAAGISLGAASRVATAPSGGGGSGGGAYTGQVADNYATGFMSTDGSGPARPISYADQGRSTAGGQIVNVYQSSVISPGPQDAINIKRAMDEGRRAGVTP